MVHDPPLGDNGIILISFNNIGFIVLCSSTCYNIYFSLDSWKLNFWLAVSKIFRTLAIESWINEWCPKGSLSHNVQVSLLTVFCGFVSAGMIFRGLSLLAVVLGVLSLVTVNALLYKFGYDTSPPPCPPLMLPRVSATGFDYVSQFKSSQYSYSYRSYKIKLHIFYKFYVFDACSVYTETEASP